MDGAERERRATRGRLSSIDLLPEEAQDAIAWADAELAGRSRTAADILEEFNGRLIDMGLDPISKSAFNRRSIRLSVVATKLAETKHVLAAIAPQFDAGQVDRNTIVLGEFLKTLIFDVASSNDPTKIGAKGAMELAKAHLAVIQGQKISSERRAKLEADFKAEAGKRIDEVVKQKGLSEEAAENLRRELFGLPPEKEPTDGA